VDSYVQSDEVETTDRATGDPKPRVIFVALVDNVGSERVIAEMAESGCRCALMSPPDYYCTKTKGLAQHFTLPKLPSVWLEALFVRRRLEAALRDWCPVLVLPLDDISAWLLRSLAVDASLDAALRQLLVTSLGSPEGYAASVSRLDLMQAASRLGIRKPKHWDAANLVAGETAPHPSDFPVFLKMEHTCGGAGVRIVRSENELVREMRSVNSLSPPKRLSSWAKRFLQAIAGFQRYSGDGVLVQSFADGIPAFRTVATWKGRVVAGLSFAAEKIDPELTGASTVVRRIENPEMNEAAAAVTASLGCSGIVAFDFMLDERRDRATLIEMNPRSVGSCHLGGLFGSDICGALVSQLTGSLAPLRPRVSDSRLVALFPKELERDPCSQYLHSPDVLHDIPVDEPEVIEAYLARLTRLHPSQAEMIKQIIQREVLKSSLPGTLTTC
jgi:biotin carboxylase